MTKQDWIERCNKHLFPLADEQVFPLANENLFPLVEAVEKATGRRPHLSTVLRWGTRGSNGIRLETAVLGGRRLTSVEAVLRHVAATTEAKDGVTQQPIPTQSQQERAATRSAKNLADRLAKR